jgi:hypothetical protein
MARVLKKLLWPVAAGILFFCVAGVANLMATDIIVWFGLPLLNVLVIGAMALGALSLLGGSALVLITGRRQLQAARQQARLAAIPKSRYEFGPGDEVSPEKVRAFLIAETEGKPLLKDYRDHCLAMMDAIDSKQEKLDAILNRAGRNDQLRIAVDALQSAEDTVCANITKVANRAAIWDAKDAQDVRKKEIYDTYRERIETYIARSDEIMNGIDKLLDHVMLYIDDRDNKGSGSIDLDVTIATLKNLSRIDL